MAVVAATSNLLILIQYFSFSPQDTLRREDHLRKTVLDQTLLAVNIQLFFLSKLKLKLHFLASRQFRYWDNYNRNYINRDRSIYQLNRSDQINRSQFSTPTG